MKMSYLRELAIYKAGMAHGNQEYDGKPYLWHLGLADKELERAGFDTGSFVRIAVWLHDALEDSSRLSEREIRELFGESVADIVVAVTSKPGGNRSERWAATVPGILTNEGAVAVKLADRIANISHTVTKKNDSFLKMYLKEHHVFSESLVWAHPFTENLKIAALTRRYLKLVEDARR